LSLASVLVIRVNSRTFSLNVAASASEPACRLARSGLESRFSVGSSVIGSAAPATLNLSPVIVSLNSRLKAPREVWPFSMNSVSSFSSSW